MVYGLASCQPDRVSIYKVSSDTAGKNEPLQTELILESNIIIFASESNVC